MTYCRECRYYIALMNILECFGQCSLFGKDIEADREACFMFKGVRSEYNKNANNYYETMKGESSLFIDNNVPVYQIILIPTMVRHKKSNGEKTFETPTEHSYLNYCNFINNHAPYWNNLKLGVFYLDIDYDANYKANYSNKIIPNMESTLTEGLINFMRGV